MNTIAIDLDPRQQTLLARLAALAQEKIAPRAAEYDRTATFPAADFQDLFQEGFLSAAVPVEYGGLGLGPYRGDVLTLWLITKELAKADLSLARCWEGHVNSLVLLERLADDHQKRRWFEGVVASGEKWVAWSGEPQSRIPGQQSAFGTSVEQVDGGYVVDGSKVFSTSASGAEWAILLVNPAGPGAARHGGAAADSLLMLACRLDDPTVSFDDSWWDPIGMRATVSHLALFKRTFIPEENRIGPPGEYLRGGYQACFTPHYAASFLGAAEAAFEFSMEYLAAQDKTGDPYVQQHVGQMAINLETGQLWLRRVAQLWETGRWAEAKLAGNRARYLLEQLAEDTVRRAIRACGARCLIRPSSLERVYRDLSFYVRHDNCDHVLATVGKSLLGKEFDISFFNQQGRK